MATECDGNETATRPGRDVFKCFFECCRFLNVCMQCSVDVIESLVEPLRV